MDVLAKRSAKAFDLGPGEPREVFESLKERMPLSLLDWYRYPAIGGEPQLRDAIRAFMKARGLPCGGRIIVTNGAKQALGAAIRERGEGYRIADQMVPIVTHWGGFWPTLKSIAELNGTQVVAVDTTFPEKADIVTSPSNPDGRAMCQSYDKDGKVIANRHVPFVHPIWDAAYASPAYGWDGFCVPSRIQVYSMAKLFGLPGIRVGWAHTEDSEAADFMESYVEVQTSGVNQHSQFQAAAILEYFVEDRRYKRFAADVRRRLSANRGLLESALRVGDMTESRDTGEGMYLFVKVRSRWSKRVLRALEKLDVGYVSGGACGLQEKNLLRFNLAQDYDVVSRFAAKLDEELR